MHTCLIIIIIIVDNNNSNIENQDAQYDLDNKTTKIHTNKSSLRTTH